MRPHNKSSLGDRTSDAITNTASSWPFIIGLNLGMLAYGLMQHFLGGEAFDPYPYILLNLFLSWMAANQAPIIMMSQRRQEAKEHERDEIARQNLKSNLLLSQSMEQLLNIQTEQLERIINELEKDHENK